MLNLILVHFFGLLAPGPDFFYVSRMAASNTRRNVVCGIFGITLGVLFWATSAILGLAVLFTTYPALQGIIMILGGGYLVYLGVLMLRLRENVAFDENTDNRLNQATTIGKEIRKGLWVNLSNAKAIIYFSSVMSFVLVNLTETWQILTALLIILFETFFYFYFISIIFSRKIAKRFYGRYSRYIDNLSGLIFVLFGGYLIYSGVLLEMGNRTL